MRILHIESSSAFGGQELHIINVCKEFKKRGHKVAICVSKDAELIKVARKEKIEVFTLNFNLFSIKKLLKILNEGNFQILVTHSSKDSWIGAIIKKFFEKNIILCRTRHIETDFCNKIFTRWLYKQPDIIFTTSKRIKEGIERLCAHKRVFAIPTGVDIEAFSKYEKMNFSKKNPIVGSCGVLRSWKGYNYLLEAAKIILEKGISVDFLLVGDGPQKEALIGLAKRLNIIERVQFLGYKEHVAPFIDIMDVFVLPSFAHEGIPQAILQALYLKKPVVATACGGIPEVIIHGETGLLVEPKNAIFLSDAIITLLKNKELSKSMGEKGREMVLKYYTIQHTVDIMEELFFSLLNA